MILPDGHTRPSSSFLGVGAALLELLASGRTVSGLWAEARRGEVRTFEGFTPALDMLCALGLVEFGRDGLLARAKR